MKKKPTEAEVWRLASTPDPDLELERVLAMSDEEIRASLASHGYDLRVLEVEAEVLWRRHFRPRKIHGGYLVASVKYQIAPNVYWHDIIDNMLPRHFWHGFIKTFVFAVTIAFVSCFKGISTRGGAEGVGKSTTAAVVMSMISVIILDYFATAVLNALGIT